MKYRFGFLLTFNESRKYETLDFFSKARTKPFYKTLISYEQHYGVFNAYLNSTFDLQR